MLMLGLCRLLSLPEAAAGIHSDVLSALRPLLAPTSDTTSMRCSMALRSLLYSRLRTAMSGSLDLTACCALLPLLVERLQLCLGECRCR
jgi:hypothetical protein